VPDSKTGQFHPPTAQHALREGKTLAKNLIASVRGGTLKPFSFSTIGQLAAIGRRTGVTNIFGINFSGFIVWWMWRTIYLSKLPRFEKKLRVALDWTLDLLFTKDLVQFQTFRAPTVSHADDGDNSSPLSTSRVTAVRALGSRVLIRFEKRFVRISAPRFVVNGSKRMDSEDLRQQR
jgi:hypothetical protein